MTLQCLRTQWECHLTKCRKQVSHDWSLLLSNCDINMANWPPHEMENNGWIFACEFIFHKSNIIQNAVL